MLMFGNVLSLLKKKCQVSTDNLVMWLHYRATALLLLGASLVVTSEQFFGKPIACGPPPANVPISVLELFCWTRATYSLRQMVANQRQDQDAYPGLGPKDKGGESRLYRNYYQWVWIVLVLQAAAFYLPRFLWKRREGGRVAKLSAKMADCAPKDEDFGDRVDRTVASIRFHWGRLDTWTWTYFACEILSFVNVVGQVFIIDRFLSGAFLTYGTDVLWYSYQEQESRDDPMVKVFPRLTKCSFRSFGASGSVQEHDALCVLPLNILNEKIYVLIWFWLLILAMPTGLLILYRLLLVTIPYLRYWTFKRRFSTVSPQIFKDLVYNAKIGDWFLLMLLGSNLAEEVFCVLVQQLNETIEKPQDIQQNESFHQLP